MADEDSWKALEIKVKYDNLDDSIIISKHGEVIRGRGAGRANPDDDIYDYAGKNRQWVSYEFPFLEYAMFIEICKLGVSKIGIKDIIHLIYAKDPPVIFLVSNDSKLRDIVTSLDSGPHQAVEGISPGDLLDKYLRTKD